MVTSQINGLGFTAAVSAETAYVPIESENAFLQALQGQMPAAEAPVSQDGQISPEILEKITGFVQGLAQREGKGTNAIVKRIMEILIARITGGDTGKKTQEKEQIGDLSEKNVGFDEIPQDIMELIAQELQEIVDQQAFDYKIVTSELSVRTVSVSLTSEPIVKAMPSQTKVQPNAFLENESPSEIQTAQQTQTAEQILQQVKSNAQAPDFEAALNEGTEFSSVAVTPSASFEAIAQPTVQTQSHPTVQTQSQQTVQASFISVQTEENTVQTTDVAITDAQLEASAEKILNELISFAKSELGLSKAEIVYSEHKPEQTRQFFSVQTMMKSTEQTGAELAQLIGKVSVQENADDAQSGFTFSSDLNGAQTEKTQTALAPEEIPFEAIAQTIETPQSLEQPAQPMPVEVQVAQRVNQAILSMKPGENGEVKFKMTLNPETLGEIEVTITATEGKATVEIITQSKQTQSILAERLEGLQTALKQEGVELEKYQVVYAPDQTQNESRSYDGSSKNPYSRRQSEGNDETDESIEFSEILKAL